VVVDKWPQLVLMPDDAKQDLRGIMRYLMFVAALLSPLVCMPGVRPDEINREQLFSAGPEWKENYNNFQPSPQLIETLKQRLQDDLRIDVYLGLWCSDSRHNVPPFVKILDQLGTSVPVRYFGVQRKTSGDEPYYVDSVKVERVPTFIFYRHDTEIGRIVENPEIGLAEDMAEILLK
jgi:Thioredoxin